VKCQHLIGEVVTGSGNFAFWIDKLHDHYTRKTGLNLFPGTLNVKLAQDYRLPPDCLRLEKEEYGGSVSVSLVPCRIFGRAAFILRTDLAELEGEWRIIEIATDVKLRDAFKLSDGDAVTIEL
jgi:riboflavin kinase, archaea type